MDFEFDIPVEGEIDEQKLESRGNLPSGWYRAKCTDAFPDQKDNAGVKLVFALVGGAYDGREIKDTLWDPEQSDTDDKRKKTLDRVLLITRRLGMREDGQKAVNIRKGIGRDVVLQLKKESFPFCQTCNAETRVGRERNCPNCGGKFQWLEKEDSYANVTFDGVYPVDHPKIPAEVRAQLKLGPAREEAGDGAQAPSAPAKPAPKTPSGRTAAAKPAPSAPPPPAQPPMSREEKVANMMDGF